MPYELDIYTIYMITWSMQIFTLYNYIITLPYKFDILEQVSARHLVTKSLIISGTDYQNMTRCGKAVLTCSLSASMFHPMKQRLLPAKVDTIASIQYTGTTSTETRTTDYLDQSMITRTHGGLEKGPAVYCLDRYSSAVDAFSCCRRRPAIA